MALYRGVEYKKLNIYLDDLVGQIYALLVLTVAASETALGSAVTITLILIVSWFKIKLNFLKCTIEMSA